MYYYDSHVGGYYKSETLFDQEQLFCEECCCSDMIVGRFDGDEDFLRHIAPKVSVNSDSPWGLSSILEDLKSSLTFEEAKKVIDDATN